MASINNLVSYELNGVKESFANWISNLSPTDTPFVSMTGKEAVKNKFFQWQEDQLGKFGSNAVAEGSDAVGKALVATAVKHNVTQILRKTVQVSDTANALSNYGRGKEMQYQLEKAGKEIKRDLEWALLNQKAAVDDVKPGVASGNALVRYTAGFEGLVAPLDAVSPEDAGAIVHQSGPLTEENLFKLTEGLYLAGACPDIIMFHPKHAKFFSGLMETTSGTRVRMFDGASDTKVNMFVSTLVDPLGCTYKLVPNRFMPADRIFFFMAGDWTQMVLRTPTTQLLAKTGSFDKYMIEMEVGLRHKNQFASGILEVTAAVANGFTGIGLSGDDTTGYTFSAVAGSGPVTITRTPAASAAIVIKTNGTRTVASAPTTSSVVLTPGTAGAAEDIVLTVDGTDITITATVTTAPATKTIVAKTVATAKAGSTVPAASLFTFDGTPTKAVASDFTYAINPAVTGVSVDATGIVTIADTVAPSASKNIKVVATAKPASNITSGSPATATITAVTAPDLTGFSLAGTATGATFDFAAKTLVFAKLSDSSAAGIVLTPTAVPANAALGALTVANADDTKAVATVAPAGKFTIKPVLVDTTGTTVTLKVAGAPDYVLTVTTLAA